ncbi:MAG: putative Zn finger protein [Saprospiraceae bacterium]|jgi:uncharacterized Zn finger protein|tara:strand:- start:2294 stop:2596 length:303 start_codon:yes stop_codon:yes gene_type:complete
MKITHSSTENLNTWFRELQEFQLDSFFDSVILGRAFEYVSKVKLIASHKTKIICQISGTKKYDIEIKMVGNEILGSCTCPYDQKCKHLAAVMLSQMDIKY